MHTPTTTDSAPKHITIIAAITRDRALGKGGDMIHHISADLRRFKQITMGHPLVMGRRTFESFPNGPLPGRRNIVVTRNADYHADGIETYQSLSSALAAAGDGAMIIGGGQIYTQAMSFADTLEITEIDDETPDADTFFPTIDTDIWKPSQIGEWLTDARSEVRFRYITYRRNKQ